MKDNQLEFQEINKSIEKVKEILKTNYNIDNMELKKKIYSYIDGSGKYLRASIILMLGNDVEGKISKGRLYLAAFVEGLHLATLIHDDVIDASERRRGISTIQTEYSNKIAIYLGDYMLINSIKILFQGLKLLKIDKIPSSLDIFVVENILNGEIEQLFNQNNIDITLDEYVNQIKNKTGTLFALSAQLGICTPKLSYLEMSNAYKFGQNLGIAFQILDDIKDYTSSINDSGKPSFQDFKNGIFTAPVIFLKEKDPSLFYKLNPSFNEFDISKIITSTYYSQALDFSEKLLKIYYKNSLRYIEKLNLKNDKIVKMMVGDIFEEFI